MFGLSKSLIIYDYEGVDLEDLSRKSEGCETFYYSHNVVKITIQNTKYNTK